MPTALPIATDFTGVAITEAQFKTAMTSLRDYLAGLLGTTGATADARTALQLPGQIQSISASVAANAMTVSAGSMALDFRSATLTSGAVSSVSGTPASLVIPSTATLGTVSAVQSRIVVLALNNAGTIELAVVNQAGGVDLGETGVINTTAISTGANSAGVIYSNTARTAIAYRVLGFIESTQATAGTWASTPSTVQGAGGQALDALAAMGYGQTWQTPARSQGTTYYNTTGKPIFVIGSFGHPSAYVSTTAIVGGVTIGTYYNITPGGAQIQGATISFIVPPGMSYSINSSGVMYGWAELR